MIDDGGHLFLKREDLDTLHLNYAKDRALLIQNESYVPLDAVIDIRHTFDENKLTLSFIGKTTLTEKNTTDIFALDAKPRNLYYPRETSAFLNYGLTYSYDDPIGFQSYSVSNKLGARSGDVFFVSDSLYTKTKTSDQFVRLQSSATYERRDDLQWLVLGDQFATSGDLGSTVNMGGIGFSKVYKVDPYLITQPVFNLQGSSLFPTQADIYLDGALISKKTLPPGSFDLRNIYSYMGAHSVEVVLRDPFGNEQRISSATYFNNQMLREGLHEYSYNVGFLRENYGLTSDDYGKKVFSLFHRYGVTNSLNVGARAEGSDGTYNGGLSASALVPRAGAFTVSVAESSSKGNHGAAGSFQHSYQFSSFNTNLLLRGFSRDYSTVSAPTTSTLVQTRYEASVGAGFLVVPVGSFSLNYSATETYDGAVTRLLSANFSRTLSKTTSIFVTASTTRNAETTNSVFVGLNFNFDKNLHGTLQYNKTGDANTETAQIQKDIPVGEGVGYRAALNRTDTGTAVTDSFNPFVQYNGRYGIYSLDSDIRDSAGKTTETYSLSTAGSFVYAGGFSGMSRPVNDSFGIVMVDKVPGAAVLDNGQEIGKTNSSGTLVVPTLTSYGQNMITLDVKNISMDYSISGVNKALSPSLWSGSCVAFDAVKMQAVTGSLSVLHDGKMEPLEYQEGIITVGTQTVTFPTGKGGEFYIENTLPKEVKEDLDSLSCRAIAERRAAAGGKDIKPGTYPASIDYAGQTCVFQITFPKTDEMITDLGRVVCEPQKPSAQPLPAAPVPSPAKEQAAIQPPPAPERPGIPLKADLPPDIVIRPQISLEVPVETGTRPYTSTSADSVTVLTVKCGNESRLVFSNVGDDIVKNVCPSQGSATEVISREDREALAADVRYLIKNPETTVEIAGHADRHGSDEDAQRVGMYLASIIQKYFVRAGVKSDRIRKVESLGRKKMLCTEETAACDAMNRRIVVRIARENP
jgi:outer membrane usher protein